MPTPTGLPKAGERVSFQMTLPGHEPSPVSYGTVLKRGTGDYFTLYVRWDKGSHKRPNGCSMGRDVDMLVDAAYALRMGWLKVIS